MKMKKTMIMAAMVVFSATAFAQDDLVKQAEKMSKKGQYAEAVSTITPALTSDQTVDKAKAWNVLSNIYYTQHENLFKKQQEELVKGLQPTVDVAAMNDAYVKAFEAAIKCDEYDMQPNEKGKVKSRFRSTNADRYLTSRVNLITSGQDAYNKKDMNTAIKNWKMYVDCHSLPLFEGKDLSNDPYLSQMNYYVALASYQSKDYPTAIEYAKKTAQDTARAKDANEIILFSMKDGAKTKADTLAYLNQIKDLHKAEPAEQRYFNLLMDYYTRPGRQAEMIEWTKEEIAIDPNNKMCWALKGEAEMNTDKLDDAIASYKKALELDPEFVQVIFNTGVCLNSKAIKLKDELADKKTGGLTKANADKVKAVLEESKTYMLKVKELDPTREKVNWVYPLYQIYYSLGDEANAAEMEKLLGN